MDPETKQYADEGMYPSKNFHCTEFSIGGSRCTWLEDIVPGEPITPPVTNAPVKKQPITQPITKRRIEAPCMTGRFVIGCVTGFRYLLRKA